MAANLIDVEALVAAVTDLESVAASPELAIIVEVVGAMLDPNLWGDCLSYAHLTLAAHFAVLTLVPQAAGAGGAVTAERLDKLGVSYQTGAYANMRWADTKWGQLHSALLESLRTQRATFTELPRPDFALPDGRVH